MIIQAALVAVVAFLASVDEQLFGASMMARPLFTGMLVGAIMGDIQTGVTVGAALEAMFMGSIMVGSAVPPEVYASSTLSIAVAMPVLALVLPSRWLCPFLSSCRCGEISAMPSRGAGLERRSRRRWTHAILKGQIFCILRSCLCLLAFPRRCWCSFPCILARTESMRR